MMKRILSLFLVVALCFGSLPMPAAAEAQDHCHHHEVHTDTCGYAEGVPGSDCTHSHDESCGFRDPVAEVLCACEATDETGALVHTEGCGYVAPVAGADCTHVHDDNCGFIQAVSGSECTYFANGCPDCGAEAAAAAETTGATEAVEEVTDPTVETTEPATEPAEENTEPSTEPVTVCNCGTDDDSTHATTCPAYIAPDNPQCFCVEKCTEVNEWCDVCGFDVTACQGGAEEAVVYLAAGETFEAAYDAQYNNVMYTFKVLTPATAEAYGTVELTGVAEGSTAKALAMSKKVTDPDGLTYVVTAIGSFAFNECTTLESVSFLQGSVKTIGDYAFQECTALDNVSFSATSVEHIGNSAFFGCTGLTTLYLNNSLLTYIGEQAFSDCTSLKEISLWASKISFIGAQAFYNCAALESVNLTTDGATPLTLGAAIFTMSSQYGGGALTEITIPKTVETVPIYAFMGQTKLATVNIEAGVKSIDECAFMGCTSLSRLIIEEGVQHIEMLSASPANNFPLETVSLPASVTELVQTFANQCGNLTRVVFVGGEAPGYYVYEGSGYSEGTFYDVFPTHLYELIVVNGNGDGAYATGETVTLPASGNVLEWKVTDGDASVKKNDDGSYTLTMGSSHSTVKPVLAYPLFVGGTQLTSENLKPYEGVTYDPDTNTLTLENAALSVSADDYGIEYTGTTGLTILVKGEYSTITGSSFKTICASNADVTIVGQDATAILTCMGGIFNKFGSITVKDLALDVTDTYDQSAAISAGGKVTFVNSVVNAMSDYTGVYAYRGLTISGGTVIITCNNSDSTVISCDSDAVIQDGAQVTATGGKYGLDVEGTLTVGGGSTITATVTADDGAAIYAVNQSFADGIVIIDPAGGSFVEGNLRDAGGITALSATIGPAHVHNWGDWTSDGDGTHSRTCTEDANHVESGDCSGGEATCTTRAVCATCGESYGDVDADAHSFDETTGNCTNNCGVYKLVLGSESVGDWPYAEGWNNEVNLLSNKGLTMAPGKTGWENGDKITLTLPNGDGELTYQPTLTYDGSEWAFDAEPVYDLTDSSVTYDAVYSNEEGEHLEGFATIDGNTLTVTFDDRTYSRLRILGTASTTYTVTVTGFTPAGASEAAADNTVYTLTADASGNAYLYGIFAEGATVTVKTGETGVESYTFPGDSNGSEIGKSYVLCVNHDIVDHVCTLCGAMELAVSFDTGDFEWKTGDQIRLVRMSTDEDGPRNPTDYYFTATVAEDGEVTWTPDKSLYWDGEGEHILIVSYPTQHPYHNFAVPSAQNSPDALRAADAMNARWTGAPTTNAVEFKLNHRMAKVMVNYEFAAGVTAEISKIEVYSNARFIIFNNTDGLPMITSAQAGTSVWVTPYLNGNQFTAFVSPDAYAADDNFIRITLSGGTVYEVKLNKAVTFAQGGEYSYKVIISADGAQLVCGDECSFVCTDNGDGTHKKACSECGCVEIANEAHTGGTATCQAKAVCTVCNNEYGELLAHNWSVSYDWNDDGKTCTAIRTCGNIPSHNETEAATVTGTVKTEATCVEKGWTTYTANFDAEWAEDGQTKDVRDIPATGDHNYVAGTYVWSDDYSSCTVTGTCGCNATTTATAEVKSEQTKAPTCTEKGETTYTATFTETWATTQTKTVENVPATDHAWSVTYTWSDDGKTCTATHICGKDASHNETETAVATGAEKTAATCTEKGWTTYTANFDAEWATDVQTKDVQDIPAKNHAWSVSYQWSDDGKTCTATRVCGNDAKHNVTAEAEITSEQTKAPTCVEKGETTYTATFDVDWAETQTKTVVDVSATGDHNYVAGTYVWNDDYSSCTVTGTCGCGATTTATAEVKSEQTKAPTCTEKGETTYTATFSETWATTQTKTVADIAAKNHAWSVTYTWSDDGKSCTATHICGNDASHNETETAVATGAEKTAATCTEKGWTTYTANFDAEWAVDGQTKDVQDIPVKDHDWTYTVKNGTITAKCSNEATCHVAEQSITISAVSKTYDGTAVTAALTGSINGVTTPVITYKQGNITLNTAPSDAGIYTASITMYDQTASVEFIIEKASVTITADNKVIYVGAGLPTLTYTVSGLMDGDELTKKPTLTTDADKNQAGSYMITAANADAGDNYEISYVGGTLTVMDAETEIKTRIEKTALTEVPDGLKDTEFNTVEAITEELASRILATSTGYSEENMEHYDVTLQFSLDGGNTWILATEENFPAEGITVTLPYPAGTNAEGYDFVVSHMFTVTSQRLGTTAGAVELPKVEETASGIRVTLNGLSPVTVAWKATEFGVKIADTTNGTVTTNVSKAISGTEVTVTVTPKSGYKMATITVKDANGVSRAVSTDNKGKYYFAMPSADVTVTVTFSKVSTSKADPTNPKTGDDFQLAMWSSIMSISAICLLSVFADQKRKRIQ